MKRKASQAPEHELPSKLDKISTGVTVGQALTTLMKDDSVKCPPLAPIRLPSFRQKKAPAWLASYVTGSSKDTPSSEVPVKSRSNVKHVMPKFPRLVPPSERKPLESKEKEHVSSELRRQSTVKLENSPSCPSDSKISAFSFVSSPSLKKKATKILSKSNSNDSSSKYKQNNKTNSNSMVANKKSLSTSKPKAAAVSSRNKSSLKLTSSSSTLVKSPVSKLQSKRKADSSIYIDGVDSEQFGSSSVLEICDAQKEALSSDSGVKLSETVPSKDLEQPKMLEIVICISTSGALREYLSLLQDKIREMVWRLQSLIPNLRIGVMAHTQGGIHDDKSGSGRSSSDHNYIRTGGHSGTKWLDLGATLSQICAFVDSLESEATNYPDYVQDNLEMALWKLQRCMSWSSCSYRTVIMVGRGRPNRTSFYLQKEHWRGWIRSALELDPKSEIPVIDWELEAKLLAQMGIHIFTVQAVTSLTGPDDDEDEGSMFFRRVAEITHGQHIRITDASKLIDIMLGICCCCHGSDLLQDHRDAVRDDNDGVLPQELKSVFVSLQLHSVRRSLSTSAGNISVLPLHDLKLKVNGGITLAGRGSFDNNRKMTEIKPKFDMGDKKKSGMKKQTNSCGSLKPHLPNEQVKTPRPRGRPKGSGKKLVKTVASKHVHEIKAKFDVGGKKKAGLKKQKMLNSANSCSSLKPLLTEEKVKIPRPRGRPKGSGKKLVKTIASKHVKSGRVVKKTETTAKSRIGLKKCVKTVQRLKAKNCGPGDLVSKELVKAKKIQPKPKITDNEKARSQDKFSNTNKKSGPSKQAADNNSQLKAKTTPSLPRGRGRPRKYPIDGVKSTSNKNLKNTPSKNSFQNKTLQKKIVKPSTKTNKVAMSKVKKAITLKGNKTVAFRANKSVMSKANKVAISKANRMANSQKKGIVGKGTGVSKIKTSSKLELKKAKAKVVKPGSKTVTRTAMNEKK